MERGWSLPGWVHKNTQASEQGMAQVMFMAWIRCALGGGDHRFSVDALAKASYKTRARLMAGTIRANAGGGVLGEGGGHKAGHVSAQGVSTGAETKSFTLEVSVCNWEGWDTQSDRCFDRRLIYESWAWRFTYVAEHVGRIRLDLNTVRTLRHNDVNRMCACLVSCRAPHWIRTLPCCQPRLARTYSEPTPSGARHRTQQLLSLLQPPLATSAGAAAVAASHLGPQASPQALPSPPLLPQVWIAGRCMMSCSSSHHPPQPAAKPRAPV